MTLTWERRQLASREPVEQIKYFLMDVAKIGFAVGVLGLVGIFASGLLGLDFFLRASKVVFLTGFVPLFVCLFVAMVIHHLWLRR